MLRLERIGDVLVGDFGDQTFLGRWYQWWYGFLYCFYFERALWRRTAEGYASNSLSIDALGFLWLENVRHLRTVSI